MVDLIKPADVKDEITITDSITGNLVDLTALPALEVWYYVSPNNPIKFAKVVKTGYKLFTIVDATHYTAYIEGPEMATFKNGELCADTYIATTNADLIKATFTNIGTKRLGINITTEAISSIII
jgi:hypothetical protein